MNIFTIDFFVNYVKNLLEDKGIFIALVLQNYIKSVIMIKIII